MNKIIYIVKEGGLNLSGSEFILSDSFFTSYKKAKACLDKIIKDNCDVNLGNPFGEYYDDIFFNATDYKNSEGYKRRVFIQKAKVY